MGLARYLWAQPHGLDVSRAEPGRDLLASLASYVALSRQHKDRLATVVT